jgi:hypothetical protein
VVADFLLAPSKGKFLGGLGRYERERLDGGGEGA